MGFGSFLLVTVGTSIARRGLPVPAEGGEVHHRRRGAGVWRAEALAVIVAVMLGLRWLGKVAQRLGSSAAILALARRAPDLAANAPCACGAAAAPSQRRCDGLSERSAVRARRHIGVLIRHDLRYTLSSARGLLFLVFFGLFWSWVLSKLAGGLGGAARDAAGRLLRVAGCSTATSRACCRSGRRRWRVFRRRRDVDAAVRDAGVVRSDRDRSRHASHPLPDPARRARRDLRRAAAWAPPSS